MKKYFPPRYALPWLFAVVIWNEAVYYGARVFNQDRPHFDLTTPLDRLIPVLPGWTSVYFLSFLFWAAVYLWMSTREKAAALRFYSADLLSKTFCLVIFLLVPTANTRPALLPSGFWQNALLRLWQIDAADNLFPSIHCLVSWLCFIGVRGQPIPRTSKTAVFCCASAVFLSTLFTCQHVLPDLAAGALLAELAWWLSGRFRSFHWEKE